MYSKIRFMPFLQLDSRQSLYSSFPSALFLKKTTPLTAYIPFITSIIALNLLIAPILNRVHVDKMELQRKLVLCGLVIARVI